MLFSKMKIYLYSTLIGGFLVLTLFLGTKKFYLQRKYKRNIEQKSEIIENCLKKADSIEKIELCILKFG